MDPGARKGPGQWSRVEQESDTNPSQPEAPDQQPVVFVLESELAERWRVSHRTIRRRRAMGRVPAQFRQGQRILYRMVDVEAYERSHLISDGEQ